HGIADQKAPQAHAQEEAQEAAEEDPLAASSAGQVSSGRPQGRPFRVRTPFVGHPCAYMAHPVPTNGSWSVPLQILWAERPRTPFASAASPWERRTRSSCRRGL